MPLEDGVDDAACIADRDTLACAVPSRVHQIGLGTAALHLLHQLFGILRRMQFEESLSKASGEGRRRLGDTALCTGQLCSETREEVILRLLRRQDRHGRQHPERVGREEDHILRSRALRDGLHDLFDVIDRVRYARVLGHALVLEVDLAVRIYRHVLQQGIATDGVVDVWLALFIQVDHLGVASTLVIEDAFVVPSVLVVTDQQTLRVGR